MNDQQSNQGGSPAGTNGRPSPTVDPYQPPRSAFAPAVVPGGAATLSEVFAGFPLVLARSWRSVAVPYLLLALAVLVLVSAPTAALQAMQLRAIEDGALSGGIALSLITIAASLLALVLSLAIGTTQSGLTRVLRRAVVEEGYRPGLGDAFRTALSRFWPLLANLLLVGIGVVAGVLLCVLPLFAAIFFLMMAPYYVAALDEGPWEGVVRSVRTAVRNAGVFVVLTLVASVVGGLYYFGVWLLTVSLTATLGAAMGQLVAQAAVQVVGLPLGYLFWVFFQAAFVTVETAESGAPIVR